MVFDKLFQQYTSLLSCRDSILAAYNVLVSCFERGGKLLVCGNGGSASDSEHMVGELMKNFERQRSLSNEFCRAYKDANGELPPAYLAPALPAISLSSQVSLLTALGNDCGYEAVFAQQVFGYGRSQDALLCFSTSGNSQNIVEAAKVARALHMATIAITGSNDSRLSELCKVTIRIPGQETAAIQELTLPLYHTLCRTLENHFFGNEREK